MLLISQWLGILFVIGVALEVFLIVGKDYLLGTRRQAALEESIQQTQTDLRVSKEKIAQRRAELLAAADEAERQRARIQEADKIFAESQKALPDLIYVLGQSGAGVRFRARILKDLPAVPDRSQKLIWSCKNFVEVWAEDAVTARAMIAKQFQEKQGYGIGELVALDTPAPPQVMEAAQ